MTVASFASVDRPALPAELARVATNRDESLFADDLAERHDELTERLRGERVLVIGGAGSIGAATLELLAGFRPQALHVVDQSENNLAELVRHLRSRPGGLAVPDFRTLPIDFGSSLMLRWLREQRPYRYVLNFAAIKHVRSEKDVCSVLHMLDTNVVKLARLLTWLEDRGGTERFFCVSTDKAANPVNLMGATKRLMEHVVFSRSSARSFAGHATSARFANVAFSDGSLLHGMLRRIEKRQPLAAPRDTRRYFVSLEEAGQICALAAICAPPSHLLIPRLDPASDLQDLVAVGIRVLELHGYEPRTYDNPRELHENWEHDLSLGCYPLLTTPLDTAGEKPYEEFVGDGESSVEVGLRNLLAVPYRPAPPNSVQRMLTAVQALLADASLPVSKELLVDLVGQVVPEFAHRDSVRQLDDRM